MLGEPDLERLWELLTPMLRLDAEDPERASTSPGCSSAPTLSSATTSSRFASAGAAPT